MQTCNNCNGFIPDSQQQCPNCGANLDHPSKFRTTMKKVLYGLTISSASMTLMACYGAPPRSQTNLRDAMLKDSATDTKNTENKADTIANKGKKPKK
ncbi:MAG: hypothetical protein AAF518_10875 [Spirochaetota bacterium]